MHHQHAGGCGEFDGEVAVGHGIERILADAVETQFAGHPLAVDGKARAGQRCGAQRQAVDARAGIGKAGGVAREHLHIGQQVVPEGDGLGHLQVGEARHDGAGVPFGQIEQGTLQVCEQGDDLVGGVAQPEADVGGDLVVAGAGGVQALAGIAHQFGEALLDVEVYVLEVERPFEAAGGDLLTNGCKTTLD